MFLPLVIIFVVLTSAYSAQNYHPDHLSRTWIRLQLSLLFKVKKFWPPTKSEKGKAVHTICLYISLLLLALSLDIGSNPGLIQTQVYLEGNSTVFPFWSCEQPVTWTAKVLNAMLASYGIMPTVRTLITQCTTGSEKALAKPGVCARTTSLQTFHGIRT